MISSVENQEKYSKIIKKLGGVLVDDASLSQHFDVLVVGKFKRSLKILVAFNTQAQVVSSRWLDDSDK